jgi:hypothetical protein
MPSGLAHAREGGDQRLPIKRLFQLNVVHEKKHCYICRVTEGFTQRMYEMIKGKLGSD